MNPERKYVLVSAKWAKEYLVYWGRLARDEEDRSYGGYTDDLDSCERYTLDEVEGSYAPLTDRLTLHLKDNGEATFYATEEQLVEVFREPMKVIMQ